jgi:hypothetical protein
MHQATEPTEPIPYNTFGFDSERFDSSPVLKSAAAHLLLRLIASVEPR